jgi:integration host factor subunit alpha
LTLVSSAVSLCALPVSRRRSRWVRKPRNESQEIVERVLGEISGALTSGEGVKLSSFGSFDIRSKGERIGRNPKTGEEVPITPRRVLVFRPSNIMKDRINTVLTRGRPAGRKNGA